MGKQEYSEDIISRILRKWSPDSLLEGWNLDRVLVREHQIDLIFHRPEHPTEAIRIYLHPLDTGARTFLSSRVAALAYSAPPDLDSTGVRLCHSVKQAMDQTDNIPSLFLENLDSELIQPVEDAVELRIATRCNLACRFCNSGDHMDNLAPTPEAVAQRIRSIRDNGFKKIIITGREPTLEPDLVSHIRTAKAAGLSVRLQTNGLLLLDPARCEPLKDAGLEAVTISLHGISRDISHKVTGHPGEPGDIMTAVTNLLNLGMTVQINTVLNRYNLGELGQLPLWIHRSIPLEHRNNLELMLSIIAPSFGDLKTRLEYIPTYKEALGPLGEYLDSAVSLGYAPRVPIRCGMPPCLLGRWVDFRDGMKDNLTLGVPETHLKAETCRDCPLARKCEGIWKRYVELYGMNEIIEAGLKLKQRAAGWWREMRANGTSL